MFRSTTTFEMNFRGGRSVMAAARTARFTKRCVSSSTRGGGGGWWDHVKPAPKDPIVGVTEAFLADPSPNKINLGVGAYRDDDGKPVVLQCVRDAEAKIAGSDFLESISASVSSKLVEESLALAYGKDSNVIIRESRFAGVQTLSGTGACRLFAEFQKRYYPESRIYLSDPTWSNHHNIWRDANVPQRTFHYYHPDTKGLNFVALMDDIKNAPDSSFFLLHPCAHNPTGVDPTEEQWREISYQFKVKNHFPFFDMAYQGFASGNLDIDAKAIRIFLEDGHSVGCAQSFAKNMGLYGHRVGCLRQANILELCLYSKGVLCSNKKQAVAVKSQLQQIARAMYSSPPVHGLLLVSTILSNSDIKSLWVRELKVMASRIKKNRSALRDSLEKLGSSFNWEHITNQVGMFCFSGLTPDQVDQLAKEFHVYMTRDGRISMAGVTSGNVNYLANAIHQVTCCHEEPLNVYSMSF
ncbi:Aspartate/other aminotransferase [Trema orientale]|uniref:Aspartate aminotransferase n=1 Tax=Trema orientale TaxID=63057 RepID=A0A2P5F9D6_TREOI|nr:Aspartate/other aminotransferase [Trema orientale]